jgi:hypothetical protein
VTPWAPYGSHFSPMGSPQRSPSRGYLGPRMRAPWGPVANLMRGNLKRQNRGEKLREGDGRAKRRTVEMEAASSHGEFSRRILAVNFHREFSRRILPSSYLLPGPSDPPGRLTQLILFHPSCCFKTCSFWPKTGDPERGNWFCLLTLTFLCIFSLLLGHWGDFGLILE